MESGEVISYWDMCKEEAASLRRGMNFRLHGELSVILMSLRPDAPYADRVEEEGRVLIYEGHDAPRELNGPKPKTIDQPEYEPGGKLTQNGLFYRAASGYKSREGEAELVRVYEKLRPGIWVYNGLFRLVDAWREKAESRRVFKFRLELVNETRPTQQSVKLDHDRLIPTWVKLEVWKRDKGSVPYAEARKIFILITSFLTQKEDLRSFLRTYSSCARDTIWKRERGLFSLADQSTKYVPS